MTVLALEGSFASVLGGAPAAAVVFAGEVGNRTATDPRVASLQARLAEVSGAERAALRAELAEVQAAVRAGEARRGGRGVRPRPQDPAGAVEVGSVDAIVPATQLRPYLADAVQRGMQRTLRVRGTAV